VAAVAWIESLGRPDDHAELIAHHYIAALELLGAAGAELSPELVGRGRLALRRAGERAAALNGFAPAAEYYRAALALWPAGTPDHALMLFGLARSEYRRPPVVALALADRGARVDLVDRLDSEREHS